MVFQILPYSVHFLVSPYLQGTKDTILVEILKNFVSPENEVGHSLSRENISAPTQHPREIGVQYTRLQNPWHDRIIQWRPYRYDNRLITGFFLREYLSHNYP